MNIAQIESKEYTQDRRFPTRLVEAQSFTMELSPR